MHFPLCFPLSMSPHVVVRDPSEQNAVREHHAAPDKEETCE